MKTFKQFLNESVNPNELKALYSTLNSKYFQGRLPNIPIAVSTRLKNATATTNCKIRKRGNEILEIYKDTIRMVFNGNLDYSGEFAASIMLHEMIHVWFFAFSEPGQYPRETHGREFNSMRLELERKSGIKIPLTDSISNIDANAKRERLGVVIIYRKDTPSKSSFSLFNLKNFTYRYPLIKKYFEEMKAVNPNLVDSIEIFVSDTILHLKHTVARDFKNKMPNNLWILNDDKKKDLKSNVVGTITRL